MRHISTIFVFLSLADFFNGVRDFFVGCCGAIGNALVAIGDAIVYTTQQVLQFFASVAEAVIALMLLPLTGAIGLIFTLLIDAVGLITSSLTESALKMFSVMGLESGNGTTAFEIIFSNFLPNAGSVITIMAMMMLAFVFLISMVRIMADPETRDTPFGVIIKTILAGIFIYLSKDALIVFSKIINTFFMGILGDAATSDVIFHDFGLKAIELITADSDTLIILDLGAQMQAISCSMVLLFMLIMILIQLIKYLGEMAWRYVLFHVLIVFFPLACSLAPSKSSSGSFGKYINMLVSQGILLVLNVFILRVFAIAFSAYPQTLEQMSTTTGAPVASLVLWCFLMFGVLVVGSQLDSFMHTLGFSTGEMAPAFFTELVSDIEDMARPFRTGGIIGTFSGAMRRPYRSYYSSNRNTAENNSSAASRLSRTMSGVTVSQKDIDISTGAVKSSAVKQILTTPANAIGGTVVGDAFGRGVVNSMRGMPRSIKESLDPASVSFQNGQIRVNSIPSAEDKAATIYSFTPLQSFYDSEKNIPDGARKVSIAGVECVATASGPQAKSLYTSNYGAFTAAMAERGVSGENLRQERSANPLSGKTGIYKQIIQGDGNAKTVTQYTPLGAYAMDAISSHYTSHSEPIGQVSYNVSSATYSPLTQPSKAKANAIPEDFSSEADNQWLHDNFQCLQDVDAEYVNIDGDEIIHYKDHDTGENHILAAALKIGEGNDFDKALNMDFIKASNGADYVDITLPDGLGSNDVITVREGGFGLSYKERQEYPQAYTFNTNESEILRHAKEKTQEEQPQRTSDDVDAMSGEDDEEEII